MIAKIHSTSKEEAFASAMKDCSRDRLDTKAPITNSFRNFFKPSKLVVKTPFDPSHKIGRAHV